ncbi:hypothetical protein [Hungatella sp.]|uniref:hypothetical protein n=1 Tax=Hungatella sp. TaxID=2613924 RepID=UPI002A80BCDA|nr:hypothetical protein [Hungatella sp.]
MNRKEMLQTVKQNLRLGTEDYDLIISDLILTVCDYCNLDPDCVPDILEPFVRKKAKGIIDYEAVEGNGYNPEIASIKEGDGSITWAQTEGNTKASIYGLSESDKAGLRRHRRLRGYAKPVCKNV